MAAAEPFGLFPAHVLRSVRLSPALLRVTLGGERLAEFASGGRDQSFSLFLPHPGQAEPLVPDGPDWFARWRAMDPAERAVLRSYTVREQRHAVRELDVDFALHEPAGPASRWAAHCTPGDRALLLGPTTAENKSVAFRLPPAARWTLLTADETALPALAGILRDLPAGHRAHAFVEVPSGADRLPLPSVADARVRWLVRGTRVRNAPLLDAVRAAALPPEPGYAWLAGEARGVRALRRHLVRGRGWDRRAVTFTGYWRQGASEEDLRAEALTG
ncbi:MULTISPECIES: siderophore-interacting protein [Streptomyces]|uniref:siderophore-interacting protein n=1 Tax=Streptomyces TaxID=1883 RepID=UPI002249519D|nr:siderophore-interacting protein [Streptomyces sp. JHD 1]MCX2970454.1 siderophore-interacting protein [Streptomyces sp. JHD 1]